MEISSDAQSSSQALSNGIGSDDDKGKMMEEVMKTYIKQQERLHTILQKKQHLQMVYVNFILFCLPLKQCLPFFPFFPYPFHIKIKVYNYENDRVKKTQTVPCISFNIYLY